MERHDLKADARVALRDVGFEPRLLRVGEAAIVAGVCKSRAYEYANDGTWPFVVRLGKSVRISRRGLENWIRQLEKDAGIDSGGAA